ncbi:MAG: DUF4194 domain-containing protein [Desulfobacteraceae bacterium]|nr:DUF4194 domain-containing protein [Desulfobacteraceae bacterium]
MIVEKLSQELNNRNLSLIDFKTVVHRLLEKQVIYRRESNTESEIYDLFIRMDDLVNDYLAVIGVRVIANREMSFVIAYPPGSDIPGEPGQENGQSALQRRILGDEAGLMITLRLLYEEKIREGGIHENGCVYVPLETVFTRFLSITKREMPSRELERRSLFTTLKQLRIIEYTDLENPEQWVGIREIILHFTLDGVVQALNQLDIMETDTAKLTDAEDGAIDTASLDGQDKEEL